jgi:hypothetical protein
MQAAVPPTGEGAYSPVNKKWIAKKWIANCDKNHYDLT